MLKCNKTNGNENNNRKEDPPADNNFIWDPNKLTYEIIVKKSSLEHN